MEQQPDLEQLVNLTREDNESNNESDIVIPGPNCHGLVWRPAVKLLGFVVAFCLALLVFWRSSSLTSKRMEVQKEFNAQHQMDISGGTQNDNSRICNNCKYYSSPGQKPQKHPEIADLPTDDNLCNLMHPPGGITLPLTGSSQWKKKAGGGTYCGPLVNNLPEASSVGHAWLADGAQYVGPWKNGHPDSGCQLVSGQVQCHGGKGTYYYADGTKKHGYWHGTACCSDKAAVSRNPQCITDWGLVKTFDDAGWPGYTIASVAFNDKFLAAGSDDKEVRIYSTEDWKLVKTLDAESWIESVAINDKFLAAGCHDNKVRIYSTEDWKLVKTLEDAEDDIISVAFKGRFLAAGGEDAKVRIYSTEDWKLVKTLEDAEYSINSVAFNDKFLAAGSDDAKVRIYSTEDWDNWPLVKTLEDAEYCFGINSVAFNDKFLAAGGEDAKVRVYSTEDWKLVKTLEDAEDDIRSIAFNDKFLAAGCHDKKVRVYSTEDWKLVKTSEDEEDFVESVAFKDKFLAAGTFNDGKVRIYSTEE